MPSCQHPTQIHLFPGIFPLIRHPGATQRIRIILASYQDRTPMTKTILIIPVHLLPQQFVGPVKQISAQGQALFPPIKLMEETPI